MQGRYLLFLWLLAAFSILAMIVLPHTLSNNTIFIFYLAFLYISLAQSWNLLAGYAGLISLGHAAFFGLGAYTVIIVMNFSDCPYPLAILCGGCMAAFLALVVSKPLLRFGGVYFAMGSLALVEILRNLTNNLDFTGGVRGIRLVSETGISNVDFYYIMLLTAFVATAVSAFITRTRLGLGVLALKVNEGAARHMGISVFRTRLCLFIISAFIAGFAGGIHALRMTEVKPDYLFDLLWTFSMACIVIIGGKGTATGPIIGAVLIMIISQLFSNYQPWYLVVTGILLIAAVRFCPAGIRGKFGRFTRLKE